MVSKELDKISMKLLTLIALGLLSELGKVNGILVTHVGCYLY